MNKTRKYSHKLTSRGNRPSVPVECKASLRARNKKKFSASREFGMDGKAVKYLTKINTTGSI